MDKTYYTFRIQLANDELVRVEKWDNCHQFRGEPSRPFRYKEKQAEIESLLALTNELNNSQQARKLGEALFEAIFDDVLCQEFVNFYQEAVRNKQQLLRIELDVDEKRMPEVAALPWEFMCLPASANLGDRWLATDPNLVFSRRRALWHPAKPIQLAEDEKLRIALAISAPQDLGHVEYEEVWEALESLVQEQAERIELLPILNPATTNAIDKLLEEQRPHIFHFIGHGRMQNETGEEVGQIALVNKVFNKNKALWMDAGSFSELFNQWSRLGIVLLQACESGMLSPSKAFAGAASKIVQMNIPIVVAMQYEVSNMTASLFACEFYKRLAKGEAVDIAVQKARRRIGLDTVYRKRDFATPVIFMRVTDGYLFEREKKADMEVNRDIDVSGNYHEDHQDMKGSSDDVCVRDNVTNISVEIELKSEKGVDYTKLRDFLAAGKWEDGDRETAERMLEVMEKNAWPDVEKEDLLNFPYTDLRTIDSLWLRSSNGKFGFSVQKKIWIEVGGWHYDPMMYEKFCDCNGWRKGGDWLGERELILTKKAPRGHLPALIPWRQSTSVSAIVFGWFFVGHLISCIEASN